MARGEGRRLTYPSIPRDPTGVHARFRALNFERLLPVSPAVIKRNSRGGVATDFDPAVDARRRQPRRREEWAAAQFVWFKVWCFFVSTGSLCSLWPETGVGPSKSGVNYLQHEEALTIVVSRVGSGVGAVTLASRSCGVEMSLRIEHKVKLSPSHDRPTDESTTKHATMSSSHAHPHSPTMFLLPCRPRHGEVRMPNAT